MSSLMLSQSKVAYCSFKKFSAGQKAKKRLVVVSQMFCFGQKTCLIQY